MFIFKAANIVTFIIITDKIMNYFYIKIKLQMPLN